MATIKSKQEWVKTGQTFNAPAHLCDETRLLSKHEKEVIVETWQMTDEIDPCQNWERGTWATLERLKLRKPRKNDVVYE